ncbi:response regulator [Dyadobacter sediminis]|uniref:Response regulator n=1 Tax=Dyadobacter sediminis TaxID=1493691 RepID=A0A5R9KI42_9BACT|nr:response regulator [Dyadobacter sediminis]TLU95888.1 response regulator [Dyadobacter sediminis]
MKKTNIVYLADDDEDDRFFIREALESAGQQIEIFEAENGIELLSLIQQKSQSPASLILMDMNMPKMNGLETIAAIRSDPSLSAVPVVMISTSSNVSLIEKAYEAGVNLFIAKPSTFEEFNSMGSELAAQFLDTPN